MNKDYKVYKGKHLNMNAIIMENEKIKLSLLPELGFKMASMIYKDKNKELFFQPTEKQYKKPSYGDAFASYDTSGCDEMLPTIDPCIYKNVQCKDILLPDHGEVWSRAWDVAISNNQIRGCIQLQSIPLIFEKSVQFEGNHIIKMDYVLTNREDTEIPFIWALHGLHVFDEDTAMLLPPEVKQIINVHANEKLGNVENVHTFPLAKNMDGDIWDLRNLKDYQDRKSYKYYILNEIQNGQVGFYYRKEEIACLIQFDPVQIPYVGIWVNKGGFKGEYNCALEPTNGFYDDVSTAQKNKKVQYIKGKETLKWTIYLKVGNTEEVDIKMFV
ncbi:hypothetical protein QBE52_05075 [Clostridiaceae bacterium 35-E11]